MINEVEFWKDFFINCNQGLRIEIKNEKIQRVFIDLSCLLNYNLEGYHQLYQFHFKTVVIAIKEAIYNKFSDDINFSFTTENEELLNLSNNELLNIKKLRKQHLHKLVSLSGIITKPSDVQQYYKETSFYSEKLNTYKIFKGDKIKTENFRDENNNLFTLDYATSKFGDIQNAILTDFRYNTDKGKLSSKIEIELKDDLVNQVKSGDKVCILGEYHGIPTENGYCKKIIYVNALKKITNQNNENNASDKKFDEFDFQKIANNNSCLNILDLLANAFCKEIYGHLDIKKSIILLLLGGNKKTIETTHLRGDIHILLIGDPGVAKSKLLLAVESIFTEDNVVQANGKGASGPGLTAAVLRNSKDGGFDIEPGAMVIANNGILAIDEFDKMISNDIGVLHEAMEQQTISISKGGIIATLFAKCSILAAANPINGHFDETLSLETNINLEKTILSRFDFKWIILDRVDPENDRKIANRCIENHFGNCCNNTAAEKVVQKENIFDNQDFFKKYINFAKSLTPKLNEEVEDLIPERYVMLRSNNKDINTRILNTIIRISEASAKARLSKIVTIEDVNIAIVLLNKSYM